MAQTLRDFVPESVSISWGGINMEGFAEDTFVTVARSVANTTTSVGADGTVGITKNADRTGTVEVTLMQNSSTHRFLSAIQLAQDNDLELYRANMTITDPSGGMICKIEAAHIQNPPEVALGGDQNAKTWTFFAERIDYIEAPSGFVQSAGEASRIDDAVSQVRDISRKLLDA